MGRYSLINFIDDAKGGVVMKKRVIILVILLFTVTGMALAQKMTVKDSDSNILMEVTDEGTVGSIMIPDSSEAPGTTTNKLYNVSGTLHWNGSVLATGSGGWTDDGAVVHLTTATDKVGIGTTNPTELLHVHKTAIPGLENIANFSISDDPVAKLFIGNGTAGSNVFIPTLSGKGSSSYIALMFGATITNDIGTEAAMRFNARGPNGDPIYNRPFFDWCGSGKGIVMTMNSSGNLGINTTAPAGKLHVQGGTNGSPDSAFVVTSDGEVCIGKTIPNNKLDVNGTAEMTGFKMPTGASSGYVLTSDADGVGTWQAVSGGSDSDWTISGDDMYSAVSGNIGIGASSPNENLVVQDGNLYVKNGNSILKASSGGARIEYIHYLYLDPSESYCEVEIQGANPGDAAFVVEAHRIYGNGSGTGATYGKQSWVISCEGSGSTTPYTIVEYTGEYDESSNDKITLVGESGPIIRVRFNRQFSYDNGCLRIILSGCFNPETTTFTTAEY